MTSSSGAVDDAPPAVAEALLLFALAFAAAGVFETLLLFALAFAAGGCVEGSLLAALAFAAGGSDAARVGANRVGGVGVSPPIFDIVLATATSVLFFVWARSAVANFSVSAFLNIGFLTAITLPLPFVGGRLSCGAGVMPAGVSPGPLTSISAKSLGLVFLDIRVWRAFSAIFLMLVSFVE
jgi:hypothetical protein